MRIGSRKVIIGPTRVAAFSFGSQPVSMNIAVIRPQAMNAAMFGMTIDARKAPTRCTVALAPVPVTAGVYALMVTLLAGRAGRGRRQRVGVGQPDGSSGRPRSGPVWIRTAVRAMSA